MTKTELHTRISYAKSALRIAGYLALIASVGAGALLLIAAEALGVAEERFGA